MKIHAIQTGTVAIKESQRIGRGRGIMRFNHMLFDSEWTEDLPIYCWLIEHPEGNILIDTGETARTNREGYFPWWHPYYQLGVKETVRYLQESGPQIEHMGLSPDSIRWVVMTHLHTDHAGGIYHFPGSQFLLTENEFRRASGMIGRLRGYLPQHWPEWFKPEFIRFDHGSLGPFAGSYQLTETGDVFLLPTPGHTSGHLSVAVLERDHILFFAGDTSYTEDTMLKLQVDGVSPNPEVSRATLERIRKWSEENSLIYLPSHDPESGERLQKRQIVPAGGEAARKLSA